MEADIVQVEEVELQVEEVEVVEETWSREECPVSDII